ncbi:MAG: TolC family protein [Bacteroidia bacterium]|nr:TolC family protein [Bacteroidia bacterium]
MRHSTFLKYIILGALTLALGSQSHAQEENSLEYSSFLTWVKAYHPVSRQAQLIVDEADAKLLKARGGFDPKLAGNYNDKEYEGSNYWDVADVSLKIPTRLGVEIKGAFEWNDGDFLNPEQNLPVQGQGALGIMVPLGKGSFMDKRRADLAQAKIYQKLGAAERTLLLNDILMEAGVSYWNWVALYELFSRVQEAEDRSKVRLDAVIKSFNQGDYPGMDTLDAYNQWKSFQVQRIDAQLAYQKAGFELSNYLWSKDGFPIILSDSTLPVPISDTIFYSDERTERVLDRLQNLENHPVLQSKIYKLEFLDVERRLKAEALKPEVNVQYNLLTGKDAQLINRGAENMSLGLTPAENFKFGVELAFPIFLRKARGDIQVTKIKIQEEQLSLDLKRQELTNKISAQRLVVEAYKAQLSEQRKILTASRKLLELEEAKLKAGESNLFLVNSREQKLISSQQKIIALLQKYQIAELQLLWYSALILDVI